MKKYKNPLPHAEEGIRLQLFLEREEISQEDFAVMVGKNQSSISRWVGGKYAVPLEVWKFLHIKYGCNYGWAFHGVGARKVKPSEDKKLIRDIADLVSSMAVIMQSQDSMRDTLLKLARDFYADKHKAK